MAITLRPAGAQYVIDLPRRIRDRLLAGRRASGEQFALSSSVSSGRFSTLYNLDSRRVDYAHARQLYTNTHANYKLGAGFAKPIVNATAGFMGVPHFRHTDPDASQALSNQVGRWRAQMLRVNRNSIREGDVFARIHLVTDRIDPRRQVFRLQLITPEWVTPQIDPITGQWESCIVRYPIPVYDSFGLMTGQTYQAVETITPDSRKVVVDGNVPQDIRDRVARDEGNDWGVIPIVHFKNEPEDNQLFGRSDLESLEPFFKAYHDTMMAAIQGSRLFSRPKVKFKLQDVDRFLKENFGEDQIRQGKLNFQGRDIFLMQKDDDASFITADAGAAGYQTLLELLFYCIVQNSSVPEFVLGTAIQGSRASVTEQMPPFVKSVERKRFNLEDQYQELAGLFLSMWSSVNNVTLDNFDVEMGWPEITPRDELQMANTINILVSAFSLAVSSNLISDVSASEFLREFVPTMLPYLDEDGTDDERRRIMDAVKFREQTLSDIASLNADTPPPGGAPDAGQAAA